MDSQSVPQQNAESEKKSPDPDKKRSYDDAIGPDVVGPGAEESAKKQKMDLPLNPQENSEVTHLNESSIAQEPPQQAATSQGNHSLQDYQMHLMLVEQQNKKRLFEARHGGDPETEIKNRRTLRGAQVLQTMKLKDGDPRVEECQEYLGLSNDELDKAKELPRGSHPVTPSSLSPQAQKMFATTVTSHLIEQFENLDKRNASDQEYTTVCSKTAQYQGLDYLCVHEVLNAFQDKDQTRLNAMKNEPGHLFGQTQRGRESAGR